MGHCVRQSLDHADKAAKASWYRQQLVANFGLYTTKEIKPSEMQLVDRLCLHFATLAGNSEQISYWAVADERRAMWRLGQTMERAGVDMAYVRGIARKMNLLPQDGDRDIKDLPAEHILKVNAALYLYAGRQSRKREEVPF
jgi:hypothetical protein